MIKTDKLVDFDRVFQDFVLDAITDRVLEELKDVAEMLELMHYRQDPLINKIREVVQIKIDRYVSNQEARHQAQKSSNP